MNIKEIRANFSWTTPGELKFTFEKEAKAVCLFLQKVFNLEKKEIAVTEVESKNTNANFKIDISREALKTLKESRVLLDFFPEDISLWKEEDVGEIFASINPEIKKLIESNDDRAILAKRIKTVIESVDNIFKDEKNKEKNLDGLEIFLLPPTKLDRLLEKQPKSLLKNFPETYFHKELIITFLKKFKKKEWDEFYDFSKGFEIFKSLKLEKKHFSGWESRFSPQEIVGLVITFNEDNLLKKSFQETITDLIDFANNTNKEKILGYLTTSEYFKKVEWSFDDLKSLLNAISSKIDEKIKKAFIKSIPSEKVNFGEIKSFEDLKAKVDSIFNISSYNFPEENREELVNSLLAKQFDNKDFTIPDFTKDEKNKWDIVFGLTIYSQIFKKLGKDYSTFKKKYADKISKLPHKDIIWSLNDITKVLNILNDKNDDITVTIKKEFLKNIHSGTINFGEIKSLEEFKSKISDIQKISDLSSDDIQKLIYKLFDEMVNGKFIEISSENFESIAEIVNNIKGVSSEKKESFFDKLFEKYIINDDLMKKCFPKSNDNENDTVFSPSVYFDLFKNSKLDQNTLARFNKSFSKKLVTFFENNSKNTICSLEDITKIGGVLVNNKEEKEKFIQSINLEKISFGEIKSVEVLKSKINSICNLADYGLSGEKVEELINNLLGKQFDNKDFIIPDFEKAEKNKWDIVFAITVYSKIVNNLGKKYSDFKGSFSKKINELPNKDITWSLNDITEILKLLDEKGNEIKQIKEKFLKNIYSGTINFGEIKSQKGFESKISDINKISGLSSEDKQGLIDKLFEQYIIDYDLMKKCFTKSDENEMVFSSSVYFDLFKESKLDKKLLRRFDEKYAEKLVIFLEVSNNSKNAIFLLDDVKKIGDLSPNKEKFIQSINLEKINFGDIKNNTSFLYIIKNSILENKMLNLETKGKLCKILFEKKFTDGEEIKKFFKDLNNTGGANLILPFSDNLKLFEISKPDGSDLDKLRKIFAKEAIGFFTKSNDNSYSLSDIQKISHFLREDTEDDAKQLRSDFIKNLNLKKINFKDIKSFEDFSGLISEVPEFCANIDILREKIDLNSIFKTTEDILKASELSKEYNPKFIEILFKHLNLKNIIENSDSSLRKSFLKKFNFDNRDILSIFIENGIFNDVTWTKEDNDAFMDSNFKGKSADKLFFIKALENRKFDISKIITNEERQNLALDEIKNLYLKNEKENGQDFIEFFIQFTGGEIQNSKILEYKLNRIMEKIIKDENKSLVETVLSAAGITPDEFFKKIINKKTFSEKEKKGIVEDSHPEKKDKINRTENYVGDFTKSIKTEFEEEFDERENENLDMSEFDEYVEFVNSLEDFERKLNNSENDEFDWNEPDLLVKSNEENEKKEEENIKKIESEKNSGTGFYVYETKNDFELDNLINRYVSEEKTDFNARNSFENLIDEVSKKEKIDFDNVKSFGDFENLQSKLTELEINNYIEEGVIDLNVIFKTQKDILEASRFPKKDKLKFVKLLIEKLNFEEIVKNDPYVENNVEVGFYIKSFLKEFKFQDKSVLDLLLKRKVFSLINWTKEDNEAFMKSNFDGRNVDKLNFIKALGDQTDLSKIMSDDEIENLTVDAINEIYLENNKQEKIDQPFIHFLVSNLELGSEKSESEKVSEIIDNFYVKDENSKIVKIALDEESTTPIGFLETINETRKKIALFKKLDCDNWDDFIKNLNNLSGGKLFLQCLEESLELSEEKITQKILLVALTVAIQKKDKDILNKISTEKIINSALIPNKLNILFEMAIQNLQWDIAGIILNSSPNYSEESKNLEPIDVYKNIFVSAKKEKNKNNAVLQKLYSIIPEEIKRTKEGYELSVEIYLEMGSEYKEEQIKEFILLAIEHGSTTALVQLTEFMKEKGLKVEYDEYIKISEYLRFNKDENLQKNLTSIFDSEKPSRKKDIDFSIRDRDTSSLVEITRSMKEKGEKIGYDEYIKISKYLNSNIDEDLEKNLKFIFDGTKDSLKEEINSAIVKNDNEFLLKIFQDETFGIRFLNKYEDWKDLFPELLKTQNAGLIKSNLKFLPENYFEIAEGILRLISLRENVEKKYLNSVYKFMKGILDDTVLQWNEKDTESLKKLTEAIDSIEDFELYTKKLKNTENIEIIDIYKQAEKSFQAGNSSAEECINLIKQTESTIKELEELTKKLESIKNEDLKKAVEESKNGYEKNKTPAEERLKNLKESFEKIKENEEKSFKSKSTGVFGIFSYKVPTLLEEMRKVTLVKKN